MKAIKCKGKGNSYNILILSEPEVLQGQPHMQQHRFQEMFKVAVRRKTAKVNDQKAPAVGKEMPTDMSEALSVHIYIWNETITAFKEFKKRNERECGKS